MYKIYIQARVEDDFQIELKYRIYLYINVSVIHKGIQLFVTIDDQFDIYACNALKDDLSLNC